MKRFSEGHLTHLTANAPPMIRVNTRLCKLNTVLQPQDTTEICNTSCADRYKKYEYSGEIDASYQPMVWPIFASIYRHQVIPLWPSHYQP